MPSLARKILVVAAIDGLILSPLRNNTPTTHKPVITQGSVQIDWESKKVLPRKTTSDKNDTELSNLNSGLEVYGVVGLLNVSPTSSFLIAITSREQVATIHDRHPIYVITDVALIPLSSKSDADAYITKNHPRVTKQNTDSTSTDVSDEETVELQDELVSERSSSEGQRGSSVGEDVIGRKGLYGRFAEKWFSKRGWTEDRRRAEGLSAGERVGERHAAPSGEGVDIPKSGNKPVANTVGGGEPGAEAPVGAEDGKTQQKVQEATGAVKEDVTHNLTPKLLHTTRLLIGGSRSFYFSYDWDITRSWGTQRHSKSESLPLWKLVDPLFFWNHHLQKPFIDSNHNAFILPLMQGFVGQLPFTTTTAAPPPSDPPNPAPKFEDIVPDPKSFFLTLISRRSIRRAGLRYLRRGVDDNGNVANSVETEQLVSDAEWSHVFSYLQIRGSIPLYFQQSPYALKPKPVMLRTEAANAVVFNKHFKAANERYGGVHAVSLVEKHGNEAIVGERYQAAVKVMMEEEHREVGFSWFDFHHECRGMRFENVSLLFEELDPVLEGFGYYMEERGSVGSRQKGVLRTNCMDCLDRTNVVQSAAARGALERMLAECGVIATQDESWFNKLWADNGDAISKQYASTAALKGDFTRTKKRSYRGALTDLGLTLSRYFTNIMGDFFTQAAIDFLLGSVSTRVFEEFEEELMSGDPAVSMSKLRENAIEMSGKIVVEDENEVLRGGWTMLSPAEIGTLRTFPFREVVILVTDKAFYRCGFDFALEKVSEFERVELVDVVGMRWGAYIISTLAHSSMDEKRNVGFTVSYRPSSTGGIVVRANTRSIKSAFTKSSPSSPTQQRLMAFKALPAEGVNEAELVKSICAEIEAARVVQMERECVPWRGEESLVVNKNVIGLAEAKKSTGLLEQWGYSLRKSVWA